MERRAKDRFLRSSELAKLAGVSTDTLRHYERKKVLPRPTRARNGYRQYAPDAVQRVLLIRRALAVGFTLDELADVLRVRDRGGAPCEHVRTLAERKLAEIEQQIRNFLSLRNDLRTILKDWDQRLASRRGGKRVGLLESLAGRDMKTGPTRPVRLAVNRKRKKGEEY